jgi:hypothetical protein
MPLSIFAMIDSVMTHLQPSCVVASPPGAACNTASGGTFKMRPTGIHRQ